MRRLAALALLPALAACGGTAGESVVEPAPARSEVEEPTPSLRPFDVGVSSSCDDDFPVVFRTQPFELVAQASATNYGSSRARVDVTTAWLYFGGGRTRLTKTVTLEVGQTKRVGFRKPSTLAEVQRMAGYQPGDTMCRTTARGVPIP